MKLFAKRLRSAERGQAILIIALAMVALAAFVGLMTDVGVMFIEYGKLKRGIDAGAIAAVQQFRNGFDPADLVSAARNFLILNDSAAANITIFRCKQVREDGVWVEDLTDDGTSHDQTLCPATSSAPRRKLIRVAAERTVNFGFLRVIGINGTTIRASSVGEAASIDLVLVIDTSASMSYETSGLPNTSNGEPLDDPSVCNYSVTDPCQPLTDVKNIAVDFVSNSNALFFPYDRVSIVAMTDQNPNAVTRDHTTMLQLSDNPADVVTAINNLKVYEPVACDWGNPANPTAGTCRNYGDTGLEPFLGMGCPIRSRGADLTLDTADDFNGNPASCGTSNIGGALLRAGGEFAREGIRRDESLWVVILLAGGPANATDTPDGHDPTNPSDPFQFGYCPPTTWDGIPGPFCRDALVSTRHGDLDPDYDADDYARDQADFLADPVDGQNITLFTIGLGNLIQGAPVGDANAGEELLRYIAEEADILPGEDASHGTYSFTPDTAGLAAIFDAIAENIFTRIAQ